MKTVNPKQKILFYGINTQTISITWESLFIFKLLSHPMNFLLFLPQNGTQTSYSPAKHLKDLACSLIKPLQIVCCPQGQQKKATSHSFLGLRSLQVQLGAICNR